MLREHILGEGNKSCRWAFPVFYLVALPWVSSLIYLFITSGNKSVCCGKKKDTGKVKQKVISPNPIDTGNGPRRRQVCTLYNGQLPGHHCVSVRTDVKEHLSNFRLKTHVQHAVSLVQHLDHKTFSLKQSHLNVLRSHIHNTGQTPII